MVLAASCAWLVGTASGARAAFTVIGALSGGAIDAQGIEGRLVGPLRVDQLVLAQTDNRVTLKALRLDWTPSALLHNRLHLNSLQISQLVVTGAAEKKPQPAALPARISLPFALQADDVRVDGGEIMRGPLTLARLGPLAFSLDFDGARYLLRLHHLAAGSTRERGTVATSFSGEATLYATRPYALQADIASSGNARLGEREVGATGRIRLGGSLAELVADVDLAVNDAQVTGDALLRPFSEKALGRLALRTRALDLSRLDAGLPRTSLDIDLSATENSAGDLRLSNTDAGTWDGGKIPLATLAITFRQEGEAWNFERIAARLGTPKQAAGELNGRGRYADGALTLSLRTETLDLQRIDRRIRSTRLAAQLDLRHAGGRQEFTLTANERRAHAIALDAHGVLANDELALDRLRLQLAGGSIDASGNLSLAQAQRFEAKGQVSRFRLHELGDFPQLPALELNGGFTLRGMRAPRLDADLSFDIGGSRLAGQPLSGAGQAQLRGERLRVPSFLLQSGGNRLNIQGELTGGDAQLVFALNAPQLALFGPAFGGALDASGTVRGSLMQARINARWDARNARLPGNIGIDTSQGKADIGIDRKRQFILARAEADMSGRGLHHGDDRLNSLSVQLRFAPDANAPLTLTMHAEGIATGGLLAQRFKATASGTTARHTIDATLQEAGQSWTLKAAGGVSGLGEAARWQGSINAFDAAGRFQARLAAPAPLLLSAQRTRLERFVLEAESGRIAVDDFSRGADGIATRGRIEHLQVAPLLRYASPAPPVRTDLQLGGEWDLRIGDVLSGAIALRREQGDLTVQGGVPVTLGLQSLNANATAQGGRLALQIQAAGRQLGTIDINASTTTGDGDNRLGIARDAPVTGSMRLDMPSLAWIAPLLSPSVAAGGRIESEIALGGSFSEPRFSGRIKGDALRLGMADLGLDLREGVLDSEFQGDRLVIHSLRFQGAEGSIMLSGPIDLGGGTIAAQLALHAERFAVQNRSDRRIIISGDSRLDWQDRRGKLAGVYTVDAGFIDLGRADKPQLSDDVVIVGREQKQAARTAFAVDLALSLGDGVKLTGRGIDALLGGEVRISSDAGEALQAHGTLNIIKGTYSAYGRELAIEQGGLRFRGAIANPTLDILAMRRGQEVEAGVSVRGTVLAPRVTLVSEPTVPDAEKLSWLVLGRALASAGGESDLGALQAAAGALLSDSAKAGVQSRIASAFGLDTFSVGTSQDKLQERIVTLGKQISSRLYVSYQQGLETAGSVVQLRYALSPKLSVEAEAGTRSAISLFYNIAFD